jgi:hypothetical protein
VVPTARHQANRWAEIGQHAARSVTLIDLCGHERYLKTTVFGLTGGCVGGFGGIGRGRDEKGGWVGCFACHWHMWSNNDNPDP